MIGETWMRAAAVGCAAMAAAPALAGPLDPGSVDRQATWVVHADAQGLMSIEPAREALSDPDSMFARRLRRLQTDFGLDPRKDLLGLTLYGLAGSGEAAVSVLTTTEAADRIPATLGAAGLTGFRTETDGAVVIHTWVHRGEQTFAAIRPGATPVERRVVIGASLGEVIRACRVIDARQPSLGSAGQPAPALTATPRAGSLVFVAAVDLQTRAKDGAREAGGPEPSRGPEALLFRSLETLTIDAGRAAPEKAGEGAAYYFAAQATTRDEQAAQDCEAVVRGLIGMGCLAGRDDPSMAPMARVARDLAVTRSGAELKITTQQSAEAVVQFVASLRKPEGRQGEPVAGRQ